MSELIEMDACNYMRCKVVCLVNNHNYFHYKLFASVEKDREQNSVH